MGIPIEKKSVILLRKKSLRDFVGLTKNLNHCELFKNSDQNDFK